MRPDPDEASAAHLDLGDALHARTQLLSAGPLRSRFDTEEVATLAGGGNVTLFIALHGETFIPGDCAVDQGLSSFDSSCNTDFASGLLACTDELDNCSGESGWGEGTNFTPASKGKRNWAMVIEVNDDDFCVWESLSP